MTFKIYKVVHELGGEKAEIPAPIPALNPTDVFIFVDRSNRKIWLWMGAKAQVREKFMAARQSQAIRNEAGLVFKVDSIDDSMEPKEFLNFLSDNNIISSDAAEPVIPITSSSTAPSPEPSTPIQQLITPSSQPITTKPLPSTSTPQPTTTISRQIAPSPQPSPIVEEITPSVEIDLVASKFVHLGEHIEKWNTHYEKLGLSSGEAMSVIRFFSEGLPLPPNISQKSNTTDFLVKVAEMERALNDILIMARAMQTRSYAFILGTYGCGKSQLKNMLSEAFNREFDNNIIIVEADLGLDFLTFTENFFEAVEQKFMMCNENLYYSRHLEDIVADSVGVTDSKRLNALILKTMRKLIESKKIQCVAFMFDEVDKITNLEEFSVWSDFITSLHDTIHSNYIMSFFSTERDLDRLWYKDNRFQRLSKWLDSPYELSSSFQERLFEGLANIFVLKSYSQSKPIDSYKLTLLEHYFKIHEESFQNVTFRKINVHSLSLLNYLDQIDTLGIIDSIHSLQEKSIQEIRKIQEKKLAKLLVDSTISFSFEDEDYRVRFKHEEWNKDFDTLGFFQLSKVLDEDQLYDIREFPVFDIFDVTTSLLNIDRISETAPTIVIGFLDPDDHRALNQSFKRKILDHNLLFINLDSRVFEPLLLYPEAITDAISRRQARILKNWFNATVPIRTAMTEWLSAQAEKERSRNLETEIVELKTLMAKIQMTASEPTEESMKSNDIALEKKEIPIESLALTVTIGAFQLVKTKKGKKNLVPNLVTDLIKASNKLEMKVTEQQANKAIQKTLSNLLEKNFLEVKGSFYVKTTNWSKDKIIKNLL